MLGLGFKFRGSGFNLEDFRFIIHGSQYRVQGTGLKVENYD